MELVFLAEAELVVLAQRAFFETSLGSLFVVE